MDEQMRDVNLSLDEIKECMDSLGDHGTPGDFEPECPGCTAYAKLSAALSQPAAAQGGFVSVPVEPDLPMVIAGENYIGRHAWKKMIEASPNFRRATAGNGLTSINFINDVLVNGELIKAGTKWPLKDPKATP